MCQGREGKEDRSGGGWTQHQASLDAEGIIGQRSLTERLVRSRLQWAGHVERMADDRLPKRAEELREQGKRRRVRPRLRWEDCVKRDVKKTGEEGDWKKKTGDRGGWKRLADRRRKGCRQHLTPDKGKKRKRERRKSWLLGRSRLI